MKNIFLLTSISAATIIVCIGFFYARPSKFPNPTIYKELGVVGDFYGGILGVAVNGAAFILLFASLMIQSRELELQRQELREAREVSIEQLDNFKQQRLDNSKEAQITYLAKLIEVTRNSFHSLAHDSGTARNPNYLNSYQTVEELLRGERHSLKSTLLKEAFFQFTRGLCEGIKFINSQEIASQGDLNAIFFSAFSESMLSRCAEILEKHFDNDATTNSQIHLMRTFIDSSSRKHRS